MLRVLLLLCSGALAQSPRGPGPKTEAHAHGRTEDMDYDMELDADDVAAVKKLYATLDGNGDGRVNLAELFHFNNRTRDSPHGQKTDVGDAEELLHDLDGDGDGVLTLKELAAGEEIVHDLEEAFHHVDADKDERLAPMELLRFMNLQYDEEFTMTESLKQLHEEMDSDKDGKVVAKEFLEHDGQRSHHAHFEHLDADRSGDLSLWELKAYESGRVHEEVLIAALLKHADEDEDGHVTEKELLDSVPSLEQHDKGEHILARLEEWIGRHDSAEL